MKETALQEINSPTPLPWILLLHIKHPYEMWIFGSPAFSSTFSYSSIFSLSWLGIYRCSSCNTCYDSCGRNSLNILLLINKMKSPWAGGSDICHMLIINLNPPAGDFNSRTQIAETHCTKLPYTRILVLYQYTSAMKESILRDKCSIPCTLNPFHLQQISTTLDY